MSLFNQRIDHYYISLMRCGDQLGCCQYSQMYDESIYEIIECTLNIILGLYMHDYVWSLFGGLLLGLSAVGYLYLFGRIAGMSGLIAQCLNPKQAFQSPAFSFIAGLIIIPFIYTCFVQPNIVIQASPLMLIIAGLLVGFGTRLGSGCTSGHGICGISRLSTRSIVATLCFMLAGFVTVYVIRHVLGGL